MRRAACVTLLVLLVLGAAPAHAASDVSSLQFRSLARDAIDEPDALARLRRVETVDGAPVDIGSALAGAEGEELDRRLEIIADSQAGVQRDAPAAREQAHDILGGRDFREPGVPRPFEGILETLGDWLSPLEGVVSWFGDRWPSAGSPAWWILAVTVFLAAIAITNLLIVRRSRRSVARAAAHHEVTKDDDPKELERNAAAAEARGDLEAAIRLRFLAGLLRLDRARVIDFHPWITSGQVARTLHSDAFDGIAATFDRVVYGRRRAEPDDAAASRSGWARVLQDANAR